MTNRERVIASLEHRQPDKTPYCIGFTEPAFRKTAEYYGDPNFAQSLGNAMSFLSTEAPDAWREVAPDIWEDQFGVRWNRSVDKDIGVVCNQVVTPETLGDYAFPDPEDPRRWASYAQAAAEKGGQFLVANLGFSLFERAWTG